MQVRVTPLRPPAPFSLPSCSCHMHFSSGNILRAARTRSNTLAALWVLYLFVYLLGRRGAVSCGPPVCVRRQTHWLLGYWETPPALISEDERDEERGWERGARQNVQMWDRGGERGEDRQTDVCITAFTSQSSLLAAHSSSHSFLPSSQSCRLLVISQRKIPRISPGHGGCIQILQHHGSSRLNKDLINVPLKSSSSAVHMLMYRRQTSHGGSDFSPPSRCLFWQSRRTQAWVYYSFFFFSSKFVFSEWIIYQRVTVKVGARRRIPQLFRNYL